MVRAGWTEVSTTEENNTSQESLSTPQNWGDNSPSILLFLAPSKTGQSV